MVRLINYLLYQIGWFACVLGAAYARPWLGIALALPLVAAHFWLTTDRAGQIKMAVFATVIGLFVDGTLLGLGVFRFPSGVLVSGLPPLWMSVLWIQFATTFAYCLHWLSGRYALSALLGLFGAPLAFLGGARLGAIEILPPDGIHLLMLGAVWSAAIPVLVYCSDRIQSAGGRPASYRGFEKA
jgi:hypothetical protein